MPGMSNNSKLMLFGGTFDPFHMGHLTLLEAAIKYITCDHVVVMPAAIPPHKSGFQIATPQQRLEMSRLAVSEIGSDAIEVSDYEIKKSGCSYSYHTLLWLKERYPEWDISFLMGGDMLLTFDHWFEWKKISKLCTLVANARTIGLLEQDRLLEKTQWLRKNGVEVELLNVKPFPMSSSEIRELASQGGSIKEIACHLPKTVVQYLEKHEIYFSK